MNWKTPKDCLEVEKKTKNLNFFEHIRQSETELADIKEAK
jgi:hypothetical protein